MKRRLEEVAFGRRSEIRNSLRSRRPRCSRTDGLDVHPGAAVAGGLDDEHVVGGRALVVRVPARVSDRGVVVAADVPCGEISVVVPLSTSFWPSRRPRNPGPSRSRGCRRGCCRRTSGVGAVRVDELPDARGRVVTGRADGQPSALEVVLGEQGRLDRGRDVGGRPPGAAITPPLFRGTRSNSAARWAIARREGRREVVDRAAGDRIDRNEAGASVEVEADGRGVDRVGPGSRGPRPCHRPGAPRRRGGRRGTRSPRTAR